MSAKNTVVLFMAIGCSLFAICKQANAQEAVVSNSRFGTSEATRAKLIDGEFQLQLRSVLSPQDLDNFNANLEVFSPYYVLKSGAIYYEARRMNVNAASAVVVSPDGYYYVAYKTPNNDRITYITNDEYCNAEPHGTLIVFANVVVDNPVIISSQAVNGKNIPHSCTLIYANPNIKKRFSYTFY